MNVCMILIQKDGNGIARIVGCHICTLTLTKEDDEDIFFKASDLILREFEKISGKFVSIGLVKITFPVDEIFTVELSTTKKK